MSNIAQIMERDNRCFCVVGNDIAELNETATTYIID